MATSEEPKVPGLERLMRLTTINLHQKSSGYGYKGNKYAVLTEGELLFKMKESGRAFTTGSRINGVDNTGQHVFSIRRRPTLKKMKLMNMNDTLVSIVRVKPTFSKPVFNINDADDVPVLRVKGGFLGTDNFQLQTTNKSDIGSITRRLRGMDFFSYKDKYTITFPEDLDVRFKLAVISTCIFIDYKYHESSSD